MTHYGDLWRMIRLNKQEVTKLLGVLSAAFPDVKIDDMTIRVYFEELKDLDYQPAQLAIKNLIAVSPYFPRIASIRERYFDIVSPRVTTIDAIALINKAISDYGRYEVARALEFLQREDKAIYKIAKAIGFQNICNTNINNYRAELITLHREVSKAERENMQLSGELRSRITQLSNKMRAEALMIECMD